jgi:hypothetical protein
VRKEMALLAKLGETDERWLAPDAAFAFAQGARFQRPALGAQMLTEALVAGARLNEFDQVRRLPLAGSVGWWESGKRVVSRTAKSKPRPPLASPRPPLSGRPDRRAPRHRVRPHGDARAPAHAGRHAAPRRAWHDAADEVTKEVATKVDGGGKGRGGSLLTTNHPQAITHRSDSHHPTDTASAASRGNDRACVMLLAAMEESAAVEEMDEQGRTALMLAALHKHAVVFARLLSLTATGDGAGLRLAQRDKDGRDLATLACAAPPAAPKAFATPTVELTDLRERCVQTFWRAVQPQRQRAWPAPAPVLLLCYWSNDDCHSYTHPPRACSGRLVSKRRC